MSGRLARAAPPTTPRPLSPQRFLASVGLSAFRSAVAARAIYKRNKGYNKVAVPIFASHPVLRDIGKGEEDPAIKKRIQQRVLREATKTLKDQFPHLAGAPLPYRQKPAPIAPLPTHGKYRFWELRYPLIKFDDRTIFVNLRPKDMVRIIPGGVVPLDSKWVKPQNANPNLYQVWEVSTVDPTRNTVSLEKVTFEQGSPIPKDRNKSSRPIGTFQEVGTRDIPIVLPWSNVQLLIPTKAVVDSLKEQKLWTKEREKALPKQIFALKLEERNIVVPSSHSRILRHERHGGKNPWEWTLDETHVRRGDDTMEPRLYTWERYATETSPPMDPRLRIDVNVPFEKVTARKKVTESVAPSSLATPASIALARTWEPPALEGLGPALRYHDPLLPNAYLDSITSAAAYSILPSSQPTDLESTTIPELLLPTKLAPSDLDAAFTPEEMKERQAMWNDKIVQNRLAREEWTKKTAVSRAEAMAPSLDPTLPMEFFVSNELSNYYGSNKMALRHEERKRREALEKVEFVNTAVDNHFEREKRVRKGEEPRIGRVMSLAEVTLTAERRYAEMWVDRQHDYEERKKREKREKWGPSKSELKAKKKAWKKSVLADRLRGVLLVPAKNQVIPEGLESSVDREGKRPGGEGRHL